METTLIGVIAALVVVIILLVIALIKSSKRDKSEDIKRELANGLKQTREELTNIIGGKIV